MTPTRSTPETPPSTHFPWSFTVGRPSGDTSSSLSSSLFFSSLYRSFSLQMFPLLLAILYIKDSSLPYSSHLLSFCSFHMLPVCEVSSLLLRVLVLTIRDSSLFSTSLHSVSTHRSDVNSPNSSSHSVGSSLSESHHSLPAYHSLSLQLRLNPFISDDQEKPLLTSSPSLPISR